MPKPFHSPRQRKIAAVLSTAVAGTTLGLLSAAPATAAACSDVQLVFARGSGERPGLGITGTPLSSSLTSMLAGQTVSAVAVDYAASFDQSSAGPGASAMTDQVTATAAACPGTKFVLGGYSQGASVTDIALGIPTTLGRGKSIPTNLASHVAAVVVFGNPLGLSRQSIETSSALYGAKAKSFCNTGDPVCGNGNNALAHLAYPNNGSVTTAATFAAAKVKAAASTAGAAPATGSTGSTGAAPAAGSAEPATGPDAATTAQSPSSRWQQALTSWRTFLHSVISM
jgi:cutinase